MDADHAKQDADEWTAAPGEFMVFYDERGNRVFCRIEKVLRVSIQHENRKAAHIINQGFRWLLGAARSSGCTEVLFESHAPRLIQFLQKLFGFERLKRQFSVRT